MSYASLKEILNLPRGRYFNASVSGKAGDPNSLYASLNRFYEGPETELFLTYDISNNYMVGCVDIEGTIQKTCTIKSLMPYYEKHLRGTYVGRELITGGPWKYEIEVTGQEGSTQKTKVHTSLLSNLFPITEFYIGKLKCHLISFAPVSKDVNQGLPALNYMLHISNEGEIAAAGSIKLPSMDKSEEHVVYLLDPIESVNGIVAFDLQPGAELSLAVAIIAGESQAEILATSTLLAGSNSLEWFSETLAHHQNRLGKLTVENAYYAEALIRVEELCRQSLICLPNGEMAGGFLGSSLIPNSGHPGNVAVWMKDNFYGSLVMSLFNPALCEQAILFFLKWGVPPKAWDRGVDRFPNSDPLTHSLSNALAGLVLAVSYYNATDNKQFFKDNIGILDRAKEILNRVYDTRLHDGIDLFPSMYISDGDSRGDFHTGSNVLAWYSFKGMARISREVYQETALSNEWKSIADRVKKDIDLYCKGDGVLGEQYYEGGFVDGSFVAGHDGEESDVALMSFYGFAEADNPAIIRHSKLGMSLHNNHYTKEIDAIPWFDENMYCSASTFPGFTSAMAGASNEKELQESLHRIRTLTDLDGSFWWWPHFNGCTDPSHVARNCVKCSWAGSAYVLQFVHNVLGIQLDNPARQISLKPFSPWKDFKWENCKIGSAQFDFSYEMNLNTVKASITNKNSDPFEARIELLLPENAIPVHYQINTLKHSNDLVQYKQRYGRSNYIAIIKLNPGEVLSFEIQFQ